MTRLFIGIILILNGTAFSQNYTLSGQPTVKSAKFEDHYTLSGIIFDSMVYEVQRGRECAKLVEIQEAQLTNYALVENSLKTQLEALQEQIALREYMYSTNREKLLRAHENRLKQQRRKSMKITLVAIAEAVVIVLLL